MKKIYGLTLLVLFTGCSEIPSSQCRELGYTHAIHNGANMQIGCARYNGNIVEQVNLFTGYKFNEHITDAGRIYELN